MMNMILHNGIQGFLNRIDRIKKKFVCLNFFQISPS